MADPVIKKADAKSINVITFNGLVLLEDSKKNFFKRNEIIWGHW